MSETLLIDKNTLTAIADAVRAKTGATEAIKVSNLAGAIAGIEGGANRLSLFLGDTLENVIASDFEGISTIKGYTFYNKTALKSVEIGAWVVSIGAEAFFMCANLETLHIGGAPSIAYRAFYMCNNIKTIYCHSKTPPVLSSDMGIGFSTSTVIYVPVGSKETYTAATNWAQYADQIFESQEV